MQPYCHIISIYLLLYSTILSATTEPAQLEVEILGNDFTIQHFPVATDTTNQQLILWITSGFGNTERAFDVANRLSKQDIEVWYVDLADNLFLPKSTHTLRTLDGRYVKALIEKAHTVTGKKVTLLSRSYGAIPTLHGARRWQMAQKKEKTPYLTGAILFSPELYSRIPALGKPPEYMPIASATTIPVMLYQAGNRGNRWQLGDVMKQLEAGGAAVTVQILPGITGVFYHEDMAPATLAYLKKIEHILPRAIDMLNRLPTPLRTAPLDQLAVESSTLDIDLKPFTGDFKPLPLNLSDIDGTQYRRTDYRGKVTVVNFWASWCGPCVEEIPALNRLRTRMKHQAFELISVNYAESRSTVRQFLESVKVDFPVLMDESGKASANWKVLVYPATYIIAPDGNIIYAVNGAIHWDSDEIVGTLTSLTRRH